MNLDPGWLLLLSISLEVWSVPLDRNATPQEAQPPQEDKQEDNVVRLCSLSVCVLSVCVSMCDDVCVCGCLSVAGHRPIL